MNLEIILFVSDNEDAEDADLLFSSESDDSEDGQGELHAKVPNFIETIDKYSNLDFKRHFRLNRPTVLILIDKYKSTREEHVGRGNEKLDAKLDIYIFLWYIANTETFRQLGNLFGVAKSTAWNVIVRVFDFFKGIGREYLKWPSHEEEANIISSKYERMNKIPNIVGVVDGTHIKIKAPKENSVYYYNRKKLFSISMQDIVDSNQKFIDIYCGEPGSYHDGRVLRRSTIFREIDENFSRFFTNQQTEFNEIHSKTRVIVENAIGLLKTQFRRLLHFTERVELRLLARIVYSACVLHNICLTQNDILEMNETVPTEENLEETQQPFAPDEHNRRQRLFDELCLKNNI